jgi:hypothetical protein
MSPSLIQNGRRGPHMEVWLQLRMRRVARGSANREHLSSRQIDLQRQQLRQQTCRMEPSRAPPRPFRTAWSKDYNTAGRRRLFPLQQRGLEIAARFSLTLHGCSTFPLVSFWSPYFSCRMTHNLVTDCSISFNFSSNSSVNGQLNLSLSQFIRLHLSRRA